MTLIWMPSFSLILDIKDSTVLLYVLPLGNHIIPSRNRNRDRDGESIIRSLNAVLVS
jgi:hypothetical protein